MYCSSKILYDYIRSYVYDIVFGRKEHCVEITGIHNTLYDNRILNDEMLDVVASDYFSSPHLFLSLNNYTIIFGDDAKKYEKNIDLVHKTKSSELNDFIQLIQSKPIYSDYKFLIKIIALSYIAHVFNKTKVTDKVLENLHLTVIKLYVDQIWMILLLRHRIDMNKQKMYENISVLINKASVSEFLFQHFDTKINTFVSQPNKFSFFHYNKLIKLFAQSEK